MVDREMKESEKIMQRVVSGVNSLDKLLWFSAGEAGRMFPPHEINEEVISLKARLTEVSNAYAAEFVVANCSVCGGTGIVEQDDGFGVSKQSCSCRATREQNAKVSEEAGSNRGGSDDPSDDGSDA